MFKSLRTGAHRSPLIVIGVFSDSTRLLPGAAAIDKRIGGELTSARRTPGFKADAGEFVPARRMHALIGLGKSADLTPDGLRKMGGKLVRALDRLETRAVRLDFADAIAESKIDAEHAGRCVAEGMGLGNWRVDFFDGAATKREDQRGALSITAEDNAFKRGLRMGLALADSTNYAREIASTPPNICDPVFIAKEARRLARATGMRCRVINYAEARKLGMGGIVNVGKGSAVKPCLVILEHKPAKVAPRARGRKIALVGKTITYDTGGYSLKINNGMKGMKYDKNGGMAVLGAMHAIASLDIPVHVVAFLPTAENMVASDAYRPDDIIEMYNGVTVEVTNTDAEGRLVLADALAYACKTYKPTTIVDLATLTGGVVVALGSWSAGLWCNDDDLLDRIEAASETTGERLWQLPLWDDHRDFMRAKHADIWNSGPKRDGHPLQGAAFLSFFVDEDLPWAHIDIAGVSQVDGDTDLHVAGPTGYGVRLVTELVEGFAR